MKDRHMKLKTDLDTIREAREHLVEALAVLESNLVDAPITKNVREAEQFMCLQLFMLTEHLRED